MPIGVASDNLTTFSPVLSPRNRHGAEIKKKSFLDLPSPAKNAKKSSKFYMNKTDIASKALTIRSRD